MDFLRSTHNLKKSSSWFWRLVNQLICQNHEEDFFKLCVLLKKSKLYCDWVFCLVIRKTNKKHGFRFSYLSKVLVHGERNPYPCSKCDASFLRMSDLDQHKQLAHEKSNGHPETCTHCESTYRRYYWTWFCKFQS